MKRVHLFIHVKPLNGFVVVIDVLMLQFSGGATVLSCCKFSVFLFDYETLRRVDPPSKGRH